MPLVVNAAAGTITKQAGALTPTFVIRCATVAVLNAAYQAVVNTGAAANAVQAWVAGGFQQAQAIPLLHNIIVVFGIGHRTWGRWNAWYVANINQVNAQLQLAHASAGAGNWVGALADLRPIKGLGSIAYASKILRFFNPAFPVLDSRIMADCGYQPQQYGQFVAHCQAAAALCPVGTTAANVESAIYTAIQINYPQQRKRVWQGLRPAYPALCLGAAPPYVI
ncbi:MAG: hypothetical protein K8T26_19625 [Lentisphaerae bacterium]|nr:hypothetical protein [Lentisphaerota bacterium]